MSDPEQPPNSNPQRREAYPRPRPTYYGVRFGTPGNVPSRPPTRKDPPWVVIVLLSIGIVLIAGLILLLLL